MVRKIVRPNGRRTISRRGARDYAIASRPASAAFTGWITTGFVLCPARDIIAASGTRPDIFAYMRAILAFFTYSRIFFLWELDALFVIVYFHLRSNR